METKDIMSKFDELYGMMASSTNVKYMHTFGDTIAMIKGEKSLSDINEEELVEYAYKLAIDLLKDKDGVYNIREYFLK